LNADWLKEARITHILNCTSDVPCYYEREDPDILVQSAQLSISATSELQSTHSILNPQNDSEKLNQNTSRSFSISSSFSNPSPFPSLNLNTNSFSNTIEKEESEKERIEEITSPEAEDLEATSLCVTYRRLSLEDSVSQELDLNEVRACVTFIDNVLRSGGNILIHCREGKSRSPTVLLYWLMSSELLHPTFTLREGYALLQTLQPSLNINQGFLRQLMQFERLHYNVNENSIDFFNKSERTIRVDYTEAPDITDLTTPCSTTHDKQRTSKSRKKSKHLEEKKKKKKSSSSSSTSILSTLQTQSNIVSLSHHDSNSTSLRLEDSLSSSNLPSTVQQERLDQENSSDSIPPQNPPVVTSQNVDLISSMTTLTQPLQNHSPNQSVNDSAKTSYHLTNQSIDDHSVLGKRKRQRKRTPKHKDVPNPLVHPKGTLLAYFQRINSQFSSPSPSSSLPSNSTNTSEKENRVPSE
jgi:protein-tyrosine phosphatase